MTIDISNIFKTIGPAASIIFAAWIFMGFLQQRYDAAVERYLAMIAQYRSTEPSEGRRKYIKSEIFTYKRRCALMNSASIVGIISAIIIISSLMIGEISIIMPKIMVFQYVSAGFSLVGLSLVIVASSIVLLEGSIINKQLENEVLDVPDLAEICHNRRRDR